MRSSVTWLGAILGLLIFAASPQSNAQGKDNAADIRVIAAAYAEHVDQLYENVCRHTETLLESVETFLSAPDETGFQKARIAWIAARRVYGRTEVFRFYNGPIDNARTGVENLINSWPVDESFIDYVKDSSTGGMIADSANYPHLSAQVLMLLNERKGETNVTLGWHVVEFLLWGQDFYADGPGRRTYKDYLTDSAPHARRRAEYLRHATRQLRDHLLELRAAWAPDRDNYRREFAKNWKDAPRRILTGIVVLSGFELSGERLGVAYETRDQEQEHSCFSDTTHFDLIENQQGIADVYFGVVASERGRPGLRALVRATAPELLDDIDRKVRAASGALAAIPVPFDQSILAPDDSPARKAIRAAMTALDQQTEAFAALGLYFGYDIPLRPGE